jgi:hypothetical protein
MNGTLASEATTGAAGERPVLHCYFREHLFMTTREAADIRARFVVFAERQGYQLGKIFTERSERSPDALSALVEAMLDDKASAVAVPSLLHLAVHGPPVAFRDELERAIGAPVLISDPNP